MTYARSLVGQRPVRANLASGESGKFFGKPRLGKFCRGRAASGLHRMQTLESVGEKPSSLRVADHHTYFVGSEDWGFSVWAHNTYYYHGTSKAVAKSIIANGIDPAFFKGNRDFGKGFYTTVLEKQAQDWASRQADGGAVLQYDIPASVVAGLQVKQFSSVGHGDVEWQNTVYKGRKGLLDNQPLPYDLVIGPLLINPDALVGGDPESAKNAVGTGDQHVWISSKALAGLGQYKPTVVP